MTFQERNDQGPEDAPAPEFVENLARELFAAGELPNADQEDRADVFEHLTLEDRERFLDLAVARIRAGEYLRMVCPAPGWGGAGHAEPITVRAGLEPVSHGMCEACAAAFEPEIVSHTKDDVSPIIRGMLQKGAIKRVGENLYEAVPDRVGLDDAEGDA